MTDFDVIMVTRNRLEYTKRTIASLLESDAAKRWRRFIIVDNGSTEDGMIKFLLNLKEQYGVFLLLRPRNEGWATAVNDSLNLSFASHVLLTNNDVIYDKDFAAQATQTFMRHNDIGILGVWRHTSHGQVREGIVTDHFIEMDDVPAVGWFLSKLAMQDVGLLTVKGPSDTKGGNGEDTTYVQRMKEKGYKTGVRPKDIAVHIDGY